MARTCCCRQPWQLRIKKSPVTFLLRFCVQTSLRNACLLVLFHRNGECCSLSSVLEPSSSLTLWAGPRIFNKRRVYGLPHAMYVAMFHCTFCKTVVRAIRVHFGSYLHDYTGWRLQICRSSSSKVVVGNGGLNSKSVVSALCLVLSWKVTYDCSVVP